MYVYIDIYIYVCIYRYIFRHNIYLLKVKKTDSVCSQLSQLLPIRQWLRGNSCTWAHYVRLHIAATNEPKTAL